LKIGIAKYLFEIGHLKHQKRTGWWRMGVRNPESVAEHSYRAAVIGYILASLEEGVNPEKTATMCLFHDAAETRIGDLHWVAKRYLHVKDGEKAALHEQVEQLPQKIASSVLALIEEYEKRSSREGQLAHEADLLECLLQAREYQMQGYTKAFDWATMCYEGLQTETAKNLAEACLNSDPGDWFQNIQRNPYTGA
jgi:putative hydrolase of HD superfamily